MEDVHRMFLVNTREAIPAFIGFFLQFKEFELYWGAVFI